MRSSLHRRADSLPLTLCAAETLHSRASEVRDTGVGIPPDKIETVFEPFVQLATNFSSRQGGIGLGLTISRQFARGMRGELAVASGMPEGASFRLTLPLAQPQD